MEYSQLGLAIDLIVEEYGTLNPIIISEKIQEDLGLYYSIHQIMDFMNHDEDDTYYERESNKIKYATESRMPSMFGY